MNTPVNPHPESELDWKRWLLALALLLGTVLAYKPALSASYVWDDDVYVTEDSMLDQPDALRRIWLTMESPSQYFPLTYTSFYIERHFWGTNPAGYHAVNILLHAANALLVWWLLTLLRVPGAWLASAFFALHPVQVESAAWVSERKNVLMGFFFLSALIAWVRYIDAPKKKRVQFLVLTFVLYALSISAKTTACTLPAALLLVLWLRKIPITRQRILEITPFVVLGLAAGVISMIWERQHSGSSLQPFQIGFLSRCLIASRALWFYLGKDLWPAGLTANYPRWDTTPKNLFDWSWAGLTLVAVFLVWKLRPRLGRGLETGLLFFAAMLVPMLGFFMMYTFVYTFVADHYQYLACIGPFALVASGFTLAFKRFSPGKLITVVVLATLGVLTWQRAATFANPETLWTAALKVNPQSALAHASLGTAASKRGRTEEALNHFLQALALNPSMATVHYSVGNCYYQLGELDKAIEYYKQEMGVDPAYVPARNNLGLVYAAQGHWDDAIAQYQSALKLDPDAVFVQNNLGVALLQKGRLDEALVYLEKAEKLNPNCNGEQNALGIVFARKGNLPESLRHFRRAMDSNPDDLEAANNLAWLLATAEDASLRNGPVALRISESIAKATGNQDPINFESLAEAQAELGNFETAAALARRGEKFATVQKNDPLAGRLQAEAALYDRKLPERDYASRWK